MSDSLLAYMLALTAGFFYACSAILCKRGLELGSGTLRSLVYSNLFMSCCFLPYPFLAEKALSSDYILYGTLLGFLFFISQMLCFISLRKGDASLMTPIMGAKPIFVAIFVVFFNPSVHELSPSTWIAVLLATIAIALISWPTKTLKVSYVGLGLALTGAAGFGLLDSLVPFFTHQSDPYNLLFIVFGSVGIFSILIIPWCEKEFFPYRPKSDRWMWASTIPMGAQAICMSMAIGFYHVPTEANIFYAGRGIWSIILVAILGSWLGLDEGKYPTKFLTKRLIGALLLVTGVWLIYTK